jgi:hypothetical protein
MGVVEREDYKLDIAWSFNGEPLCFVCKTPIGGDRLAAPLCRTEDQLLRPVCTKCLAENPKPRRESWPVSRSRTLRPSFEPHP